MGSEEGNAVVEDLRGNAKCSTSVAHNPTTISLPSSGRNFLITYQSQRSVYSRAFNLKNIPTRCFDAYTTVQIKQFSCSVESYRDWMKLLRALYDLHGVYYMIFTAAKVWIQFWVHWDNNYIVFSAWKFFLLLGILILSTLMSFLPSRPCLLNPKFPCTPPFFYAPQRFWVTLNPFTP